MTVWSRRHTAKLFRGTSLGWSYALYTKPRPGARAKDNQDAVLAGAIGGLAVFAVADGVGGQRGGANAARAALGTVAATQGEDIPAMAAAELARALLMEGIEGKRGRGLTTLTALYMNSATVAAVHVGDSGFAVFSGRGRVKYRSVSQSPAGYAIEAGRLSEDELLSADDHHEVFNVLGAAPLSIEVTGGIALRPRDTVVLGSDGLFDNFTSERLAMLAARGPLERAAARLADALDEAVVSQDGKPDDHSFVLIRRIRSGPRPQES